jgi:DNA-binding MarR family transcriptional regulator
MTDQLVPDDVRDFILRHIDSVAQLEALLLLRANPQEQWHAARTAERLYATEKEVADALARLSADGFLARSNDLYRYECTPEQQQLVDRVAAVYSRQLIPITNMIHSKPRYIREFADAFKFRKDA